ncbi:MAG TPA: metalloregulator ArsR/SmtB family transcription factor [Kineosporiaceae bacterium]|nr:metalloregulator ArsR/SmtB family transcription factor [Kineosporiaceae bacterium]
MPGESESVFGDPLYRSASEAASLLSAAADPNRMTVLRLLAAGTTCVCTIQEHVPVAPNLLSYHLKVLRDAGLIVGRRRGRWVDYQLVGGALDRLRDALPVPGAPGCEAPVPAHPAAGSDGVNDRREAPD